MVEDKHVSLCRGTTVPEKFDGVYLNWPESSAESTDHKMCRFPHHHRVRERGSFHSLATPALLTNGAGFRRRRHRSSVRRKSLGPHPRTRPTKSVDSEAFNAMAHVCADVQGDIPSCPEYNMMASPDDTTRLRQTIIHSHPNYPSSCHANS